MTLTLKSVHSHSSFPCLSNIHLSGDTLSKGLNRIMGTTAGGGLGILLTLIAQKVGGVGNSIIIGTSVFVLGKLLNIDAYSKEIYNAPKL